MPHQPQPRTADQRGLPASAPFAKLGSSQASGNHPIASWWLFRNEVDAIDDRVAIVRIVWDGRQQLELVHHVLDRASSGEVHNIPPLLVHACDRDEIEVNAP